MTYELLLIRPKKAAVQIKNSFQDLSRDLPFSLSSAPMIAVLQKGPTEIVWSATLYLAHVAAASSSRVGDTVRSYGEGLVQWFRYLDTRNAHFEEATEVDLHFYRAWLSVTRDGRKRTSSIATVRLRMVTVVQFYRWAEKRGMFRSPLGRHLCIEPAALKMQWPSMNSPCRGNSTIPLPRLTTRQPVNVPTNELNLIVRRLPPPYSLIVKWAVVTGIRRFEVCALTTEGLDCARSLGGQSNLFALDILRKGGQQLSLYVPGRLLEETRWYVTLSHSKRSATSEPFLFTNDKGVQVDRAAVSRSFRRAADAVGSRATFHHLRHTYAIYVLQLLEKQAKAGATVNPLKTLQVLLGHRHIETSSRYLTALDIHSDSLEKTLDFLYGAVSDDGN
ncbi:tyrosine-type recombinase/integrase [Paraburkholderia nemoris]|uniref:tyrosine-type recombinase/integrase n=1 Tax=Paraburkholderia nemoris TaxID=2793076 RepID=UPI0038BB0E07